MVTLRRLTGGWLPGGMYSNSLNLGGIMNTNVPDSYAGWVLTLPIAGIISGCLMGIIINAPRF